MADLPVEKPFPFDGPTALQPAWQAFADRYLLDVKLAGDAAQKTQRLARLNTLLFTTKHIREFLADTPENAGSADQKWHDVQPAIDALRDLSSDEEFYAIRQEAENRLIGQWLQIRDEAHIEPDYRKWSAKAERILEKNRRDAFAETKAAHFLVSCILTVVPFMPECHDILGKAAKKFRKDMIFEEASALFPNALYSYKPNHGASFKTYFRASWLENQLWRKLTKRVAEDEVHSISLDAEVGGKKGESSRLGELKADPKAPDPQLSAQMDDLFVRLKGIISVVLTPREAKIIRMRYGLNADFRSADDDEHSPKAMTLEEVGQQLCVTRERVRQIESKALRKLIEASEHLRAEQFEESSSGTIEKAAKLSAFDEAYIARAHRDVTDFSDTYILKTSGTIFPPLPIITPPAVTDRSPVSTPPSEQATFLYRVLDKEVLRTDIARMYESPKFISQILKEASHDSAQYAVAHALTIAGVPSAEYGHGVELEQIYLFGVITSPQTMLEQVRMDAKTNSRLKTLLDVLEHPEQYPLAKPKPARIRNTNSRKTEPKTAKDSSPTISEIVAQRVHASGEILTQEAAIEKARKAYAAMEEYSWEHANSIAQTLFANLVRGLPNDNLVTRVRDATDGHMKRESVIHCLNAPEHYSTDYFSNSRVVDAFVRNVVQEPLQNNAKNFLLGIPWENTVEKKIGVLDEIEYAQAHHMDAACFMRIKRYQGRMTTRDYAQHLGINANALSDIAYEMPHDASNTLIINSRAPVNPVVDKVMEGIGLRCYENITPALKQRVENAQCIFRKMVLGIPHEVQQTTLNQCFSQQASTADTYVNTESQGLGRGQAMARFFKILRQVHGLRNRKELAEAISAHAHLGTHVATQIQHIIHGLCVPESDITTPVSQIGTERRLTVKVMNKQIENAIVTFAFPEDWALQQLCRRFLTNEKEKPGLNVGGVLPRFGYGGGRQ